jgi:LPXTG-motif cell wall-anchored protein
MSSFNGYTAFAEGSDEEASSASEPELIEAESGSHDAEALDDIELPDEGTDPETETEAAKETTGKADPEKETATEVPENANEEAVKETNENKEKSEEKKEEKSESSGGTSEKNDKSDERSAESTAAPDGTDKPDGTDAPQGTDMPESTDAPQSTDMPDLLAFKEEKEELLGANIVNLGIESSYTWYYMDDGSFHVQPPDGQSYIFLYLQEGSEEYYVPWYYYRSQLTKLSIDGPLYIYGSAAKLFSNIPNLTAIDGLENVDLEYVTKASDMFSYSGIGALDLSKLNTSSLTDMSYMFYRSGVTALDLSSWDTSNVTTMGSMFNYATSLQYVKMPEDTSNVTSMYKLFSDCTALTSLDLTGLNTSNVTSMAQMFMNCTNLQELNITSFDTSKVTRMTQMFLNCYKLKTLDLSSFDTSNAAYLSNMLSMAQPAELDTLILGPKVDSHFTNCGLWSGVSGIYLANGNAAPSESNYIGSTDDLYAYQADESNRTGNNTYRLCDVITYDPNGGAWSNGSTDVKYVYCASGDTCSLTTEQPTKSGETFIGWDRVRDETGSLYDLKTSFVSTGWESYTFYADWEGEDKVVYDTNDSVNGAFFATVNVSGSSAPAFGCNFTIKALDNAPEPTKSTATVDFSGEGDQVIDFGTITFMRTGTYRYEITQSSADADGWVHNNGTKIVDVTISRNDETGETYISSVNGVQFYNCYMGSILTKDLTEEYKADATQRNHQQSTAGEEALYKSAQWTNKSSGEGQIDIVYNNTYSNSSSTTALYIFTNCTAHGFTSDLAKSNIKFLLEHYNTVVAVCSMKTKRVYSSDATFEKFVFKRSDGSDKIDEQLSQYLGNIYFADDMHLSATWQLKCFDVCLDQFDPDAVFFSYDGGRGFDEIDDIITQGNFGMSEDSFAKSEYPEPVLEHYDKTLQKLAELMENREYYIMIADGSNEYTNNYEPYDTLLTDTQERKNMTYLAMMTVDPVTMSTAEGRSEMKDLINSESVGISIKGYADDVLTTYGTKIYFYSQEMRKTLKMKVREDYSVTDVVEPRFSISGDITVTVPMKDSNGSYKVLTKDEDYTLTIADDEDSGGKKVTVHFLNWEGYPAKITIPITLKDVSAGFFDSNDWFDNTNVGDAYATVTDVIYNGAKQEEEYQDPVQSIKVSPPQLYMSYVPDLPMLPTAGGDGMGIYTVFGAALLLAGLSVLRAKRRYEHKK